MKIDLFQVVTAIGLVALVSFNAEAKYIRKNPQVNKKWEHKADDDGDGRVNHGELKDIRHDKNNAGTVNKQWEQTADSNQDGHVNRDEYNAYQQSIGNTDNKVDADWEKKADVNGDGRVTENEAKAHNSTLPTIEGGATDTSTQ